MSTDGREHEERYEPRVVRQYESDGIVVHWEPSLCIHAASCVRALPEVFLPNEKPWIRAGVASADALAEAVRGCPTGALRYERTDGQMDEQPDTPATVQPRLNGPLMVRGDLWVIDSQSNVVGEATRMALCRCGHSSNKPYCDLSHRKAGFKS